MQIAVRSVYGSTTMWCVSLVLMVIPQSLSLDNGWIPLSLDQVLSRPPPQHEPSLAHLPAARWSPRIDDNGGDVTTNFDIKVTRPHQIYRFGKDNGNLYDSATKGAERALKSNPSPCKIGNPEVKNRKESNQTEATPEVSNSFEIYSDKKSRKAKQIYDIITERGSSKADTSTNQNKVEKINKNYEVTESDLEKGQVNSEQIVLTQNPGFIYNVPNKNINDSNNLTSVLLNILTKYNINPNEQDTNYAISRLNPSKTSRQKLLFVTLPIKVPQGHNSENHVSPDPVLAMLLSNYGLYLPGMFGPANKYTNLYGYLASNNIHNNRPFGLYKIFSDTDSSN